MVFALAGRRIDAVAAVEMRFPLEQVPRVSREIASLFKEHSAKALVSSAACGADLIALSGAGLLGLRRRVILPFDREKFRKDSVVDRPGDWGPIFDRVLDDVCSKGDLIILASPPGDEEAYKTASHVILDEAQSLSGKQAPIAITVWEGQSRGKDDLTKEFYDAAILRSFQVFEVKTI